MTLLEKIQRGRTPKPPRLLLYGTEGIGKSTFGSKAPKPIFVQTEDGLDEIDCDRFPLAATFDEVVQALQDLQAEKHDYQT
ncbi:MAG TPA: oxidoreductase, partial [Planctomycetaceae bacterium]|nr:oxidoreductase [Planctomycetaceae bacterium]